MSSSSRKRNMLEAFQASAREAAEDVEPAAAAGGPFADDERKPEPVVATPPDMREMPKVGLNEVLGTAPLQKLFIAQLVLLVGAFYLGYLAGTPVDAAGPSNSHAAADRGGESPRVDTPPSADPSRSETSGTPSREAGSDASDPASKAPYDQAFFSLENTATLRVASYDKNTRNTKLAWEVYDYLIAEGLPVVTPVSKTQSIFIFVGATPSVDDLAEIKERVRALGGPRGDRPFKDAYAVNIDDYKKR